MSSYIDLSDQSERFFQALGIEVKISPDDRLGQDVAFTVYKEGCGNADRIHLLLDFVRPNQVEIFHAGILQDRGGELWILCGVHTDSDQLASLLLQFQAELLNIRQLSFARDAEGSPEIDHRNFVPGKELFTADGSAIKIRCGEGNSAAGSRQFNMLRFRKRQTGEKCFFVCIYRDKLIVVCTHRVAIAFAVFFKFCILKQEESEVAFFADFLNIGAVVLAPAVVFLQVSPQLLFSAASVQTIDFKREGKDVGVIPGRISRNRNFLSIQEGIKECLRIIAVFLDISIVKDGEEIQPDAPVDVKITLDSEETDEAAQDIAAVHFKKLLRLYTVSIGIYINSSAVYSNDTALFAVFCAGGAVSGSFNDGTTADSVNYVRMRFFIDLIEIIQIYYYSSFILLFICF